MEKMDAFFTVRIEGYDEQMLTNVIGCKEAYREMARLVPESSRALLDLGCGTGLELDEIFKRLPDIKVTGIDLTQAMLDKLTQKYPDKNITLSCASYFDADLGTDEYDCAVSFETLHHFSHEAKRGLYQNIFNALKENGLYIECDYMVEQQADEDFYYAENARIRKELNLPDNAFYHYDTPCTIQNQLKLLESAGFTKVREIFRMGNTTILTAGR